MKILFACLVLLVVGFGSVAQQSPNPKDPNTHFLQSKFSLLLGESKTIAIPRKDCPVQIEVSVTNIVENGVQSKPLLFVGWVVRDSKSGELIARRLFTSTPLTDCDFNDVPPLGLYDCGFSVGGKLLARLVIAPNTGNLVITLLGDPSGLDSSEFPVCVNMSF